MSKAVLVEVEQKMGKAVESLGHEIRKIRTGRAHSNLLDHVVVESYGARMSLSQLASVSVEGPRSLLVSPWDKNQVSAVQKAIQKSDLGLNPATHGQSIRVPLPVLTEERRKDLVRMAKEVGEAGKISVRNIRRAALQEVKASLKEKSISEDEERLTEDKVNTLTERYIDKVQKILTEKIRDLQEVK